MKGNLLASVARVSKQAKSFCLLVARKKKKRQHKIDGEWGGGASAARMRKKPSFVRTGTLATLTETWSELKQFPQIGPRSIMEDGIENVHVNR